MLRGLICNSRGSVTFRLRLQGSTRAVYIHPRHRYERPDDHGGDVTGDYVHVVNTLKRDFVVRGAKVARIDEDGRGVVQIFVRGDKQLFEFQFARAIPGETLHLRVGDAKRDRYNKKKPGSYRLMIDERGAASPDEVSPPCEHFSKKCGGCSFQQMSYGAQLSEKMVLLALRLKQYENCSKGELRPPVPSDSPFGFHSRTEFRFFLRSGLQLGLHPHKNPVPIVIDNCHLHPENTQLAFEATLSAARSDPRAAAFDLRTGNGWLCSAVFLSAMRPGRGHDVHITLVTVPMLQDETLGALRELAHSIMQRCPAVVGVTWSAAGGDPAVRTAGWRSRALVTQELLAGKRTLEHNICGLPIETVPEASLRPNLFIIDKLCSTVLELSGVRKGDVVWDTFCGQGPLTPLLARECGQIIAFDRSPPALAALRTNLEAADVSDKSHLVRIDLGSPKELRELAANVKGYGGNGADADDEEDLVADDDDKGDEDDEEDEHAADDEHSALADSHGDRDASEAAGLDPSCRHLPIPDVLVADPGRNGLPKAFRRFMYGLGARTIILIGSGRPLLGDIVLLCRRGYELKVLAPFDSYPHQARLDTVAQLQLRDTPSSSSRPDEETEPYYPVSRRQKR